MMLASICLVKWLLAAILLLPALFLLWLGAAFDLVRYRAKLDRFALTGQWR